MLPRVGLPWMVIVRAPQRQEAPGRVTRRAPPWWVSLLLAVFFATQGVNTWQEVFGPGGVGFLPAEPGFAVADVERARPFDVAGVRVGDVVESVAGHRVAGMADWFVVRANFEREVLTPLVVRRDGARHELVFRIESRHWSQWWLLEYAFQATRWATLLIAAAIVMTRPHQPAAAWLALLLSSIAVTEGNPSAGWLATLRALPLGLGVAVGLATVSWLFLPVTWLALCHAFPRPIPWDRGLRLFAAGHVAVFGSFVLLSLAALLYWPDALSMRTPFDDVGATLVANALFSVTPQLFLNPARWYTPDRQSAILGAWLLASAMLVTVGFARLVRVLRSSVAVRDRQERGVLVAALGAVGGMGLVGAHNVLVRNWPAWVATEHPAWLGDASVAVEGAFFLAGVGLLTFAVLWQTRGRRQ